MKGDLEGGERPTPNPDPDQPVEQIGPITGKPLPKELIGHIGAFKIISCDDPQVKANYDGDFTEGGNPATYWFVPLDEIWISAEVLPGRRIFTALHEIAENLDMSPPEKYHDAHPWGNAVEFALRYFTEALMDGKSQEEAERYALNTEPPTVDPQQQPAPELGQQGHPKIDDVQKWQQSVSAEQEDNVPEPKEGESENDYVSRCIPIVIGEGATQEEAAGKCHGMWRNANKAMGTVDTRAEAEEARSVGGFESPEPGDIPEGEKKILAAAYASCRRDNPDYSKERCSKIAWGAVHNARKAYDDGASGEEGEEALDDGTLPDATEPRPKKKIVSGNRGIPRAADAGDARSNRHADANTPATKGMRFARRIARALVLREILRTRKDLQVDPVQLYEGTCEEMEHTDDWHQAMQIATDHLGETPDYYTRLRGAGLMSGCGGHAPLKVKDGAAGDVQASGGGVGSIEVEEEEAATRDPAGKFAPGARPKTSTGQLAPGPPRGPGPGKPKSWPKKPADKDAATTLSSDN